MAHRTFITRTQSEQAGIPKPMSPVASGQAAKAAHDAELLHLQRTAEEAKRTMSLHQWITDGYQIRHPSAGGLPEGWTTKTLEEAFWSHIEEEGGFRICPACGKKPVINAMGRIRPFPIGPTSYGNRGETVSDLDRKEALVERRCRTYTTEIFNMKWDHLGPSVYSIVSINCCGHLYDVCSRQRMISVETITSPPPANERHHYIVQSKGVYRQIPDEGHTTTEYAHYHPACPMGEAE